MCRNLKGLLIFFALHISCKPYKISYQDHNFVCHGSLMPVTSTNSCLLGQLSRFLESLPSTCDKWQYKLVVYSQNLQVIVQGTVADCQNLLKNRTNSGSLANFQKIILGINWPIHLLIWWHSSVALVRLWSGLESLYVVIYKNAHLLC